MSDGALTEPAHGFAHFLPGWREEEEDDYGGFSGASGNDHDH